MKKTVFYSWQSDLPNPTNRGFIEKALEKAVKEIVDDESISVEPVIDRDTAGVGGSPDISGTIFEKIAKADVFVADISTINKDEKGRKVPNPNVLIELGYAFRALGHNKVILIMNIEFGSLESLPFDLRTRRILAYDTRLEKTKELNNLVGKVKSQLEVIFTTSELNEDMQPTIIDLIKSQNVERISGVRKYMKVLNQDLDSFYPGDGMLNSGETDPEYDQKIIDALEKTTGIITTFRSVIDEIALYDDSIALKEIFNGFKPIIENFDLKKGFSGVVTNHKAKYDYYKFLGNEMFVILTSILLREQKWDLLKIILEEAIIVDNMNGEKKAVDYSCFSDHIFVFDYRKLRLKLNHDIRYHLLMKRRKEEINHTPDAVEEYTSADLFLFLKGESKIVNSTEASFYWRPWSLLSFETPRFVLLAKSKSFANGVARSLGLENIQDFQILLSNKVFNIAKIYSFWDNPIRNKDIDEIGSR